MAEAQHVFVVDDDDSARLLVRVALEGDGYIVCEAIDGRTMMAAARDRRPDLILLDISLPERSGLEILADVRQDDLLKNIPVIILTASADEGTEWRARDLGATAYVAKPVTVEDLERVVQDMLSRKAT